MRYGKDVYLFLKHVGAKWISAALDAKRWFDGITEKLGLSANISDRILQFLSDVTPPHLPTRLAGLCERYEHQLFLRIEKGAAPELSAHLDSIRSSSGLDFFECTPDEAVAAFRHRYVLGAAAVRYRAIHADSVENLVALDVAFPRNTRDWRDNIPPALKADIVARFPCGHFLCHTFHYDYAVRKGANWLEVERALVRHFAERGAEVPSEHNVGHMYKAKEPLVEHYRRLDPTNSMNPGVGGTSKKRNWA
jgi:D-lactate dehydrogenase